MAVIGSGGAGKSTLSRELALRLDLPVIHLDRHYRGAGWRPAEPGGWRETQRRMLARQAWVVDGNYLSTLDLRLSAADTVVFLDLPRWRCAWRATRRVLSAHGRANTAPGCAERLGRRHLSFLIYIWRFPHEGRSRVLERLAEHRDTTRIVHLTTPGEVGRFLRDVAPGTPVNGSSERRTPAITRQSRLP